MKILPVSWYYNHPKHTLLIGPSGHNSPPDFYELESANPQLAKLHCVITTDPTRLIVEAIRRDAEEIRDKFQIPKEQLIIKLQLPNVAIQSEFH